MTPDKAAPIPGATPGTSLGADLEPDLAGGLEPDLEPGFDPDLERAFRRQLHDELAHQGNRPMADVVARAASRGRRRVLMRAGAGIVASMAAVVAIGGAAAVALDRGGPKSERTAVPASPAAPRPSPSPDGRVDAVRQAIARDLGDVLTALVPGGTGSTVRTGYVPETGVSAEMTMNEGNGPTGVVSVSLRPGTLPECRSDGPTPAERTDEHGITHSIKCLQPERNGTWMASESLRTPDGVFRGQAVLLPIGPTVLRLLWANGPLDGTRTEAVKGRMPLADDQGAAMARNAAWEPVARRLLDAGTGTG
ncbi:hypothetical protein ACIRL2_15640 [Embleya sp. NPDC127516]|uniref:hypothetical protein n=1 Tax=Embleya sp. NPDC127516 TaxID=3363990 RepID=UPI00381C406E